MKLKNGMIIKCNSKEDAQEFIKEAHKQGFKWVNYHEGDEEKTCWGYVCDFNSEIYYHLEADEITWSSMYSGNESIEYSTLKEKKDIMTKSDLKNGMVVELRNGKRFLIVNDLGIGKDSCIKLDGLVGYDENLYDIIGDSTFDITKIYISSGRTFKNLFDNKSLSLIWEREEKEEREEIKVGDKVKVINNGYCFDEYYDWVEENINNRELKLKFDYGNVLPNGTICEVLHINKHNGSYNSDDTLAYIQDIENKRCYLINIEGLEKID